MMVNFICQLDWACGCPDIQLFWVFCKGVLDEVNIRIDGLSKANSSPPCGPYPSR